MQTRELWHEKINKKKEGQLKVNAINVVQPSYVKGGM